MVQKTTNKVDVTAYLRETGLRPTRQRLALAELLFAHGHRHLTAESLYAEAAQAGLGISLATIYNTLHQFTATGILRQVTVDAARAYFDTNTQPHQHFYSEDDGMLIDIPGSAIAIVGVPSPPKGTAVDRVDVIVRIRKI